MNRIRNRTIAITLVTAFLVAFYVQFILATYAAVPADLRMSAWTDQTQYSPGGKGKLKISVLNGLDKPVDINEIYIEYPWLRYNAQTHEWEGNETIPENGDDPLATISSEGGDYYAEIEFEVPTDGRVAGLSDLVHIHVDTSEGEDDFFAGISVMSTTLNMEVRGWDQWMTIGIATIVICTIILAAVMFLSTRSPRIATVASRAKA